MKFPSLKDAVIFDENDPFDSTAEKIRSHIEVALTEKLANIPREEMEGVLAGMTMGLMSVLMTFTDEAAHGKLVSDVIDYVPLAANQCRDILGLPLL